MPLTYTETKSCERCVDGELCEFAPELCEFARHEVRRCVMHINLVAEIARRKLPDADVAFDCHVFLPRRKP